ncbi:MAG: hypothetical protein HW387_681 [Parachlamydiales bacterium]|nr:hypothetical protein [Parachlamydiales bacterium]
MSKLYPLRHDNENQLIEGTVAADNRLVDGTVQSLGQAVGILQTTSTALTGTVDHAVEVIDQRAGQAIDAVSGTLEHTVDVVDRRAGQAIEAVSGTLDHSVDVVDRRLGQAIDTVSGTLDHTLGVVDRRSEQAIDVVRETGSNISKVAQGVGRCFKVLSWAGAFAGGVVSIGGMIWTQRRADRTAKEGTRLANRTVDLRAQEIQSADRQSNENRRVTQEISHEQIGVAREGVHGLLALANKTTLAACSLLAFGCIAWIGLVTNWPVFSCVGMAAGIAGLSWIGGHCIQSLISNPVRQGGTPVLAIVADDRSAPSNGEVIAQVPSANEAPVPNETNAEREELLNQRLDRMILMGRVEASLTGRAARERKEMELEGERLAREGEELARKSEESARKSKESMKRLNDLMNQCQGQLKD